MAGTVIAEIGLWVIALSGAGAIIHLLTRRAGGRKPD